MTDIVERLLSDSDDPRKTGSSLRKEAAAEVERLRTEVERLTNVAALYKQASDEWCARAEASEAALAKCGKENCWGHDAGEHVMRWISMPAAEALARTARQEAFREAIERAVEAKVTSKRLPTASADYINGFQAGVDAKDAAIRNLQNEGDALGPSPLAAEQIASASVSRRGEPSPSSLQPDSDHAGDAGGEAEQDAGGKDA